MIRVLVTDDHPLVRDGLKYVMSQHHDMTVVGEAEDGSDLLRLVKPVEADVVLLDVSSLDRGFSN